MKIVLLSFTAIALTTAAYAGCCCKEDAAPVAFANEVPGESLFQAKQSWTDDSGKTFSFQQSQGRLQLVAMFYTYCPTACPRLVHKLQELEKALPADVRERTDVVLVSLDPAHDKPEVLRAYRQDRGLTDKRWKLLTGSAENVRELAALLEVRFKPEVPGTIAHSNLVTVLDPAGVIAVQETGLEPSSADFIAKISALGRIPASAPVALK
jgi:protein SCO1